MSDTELRALHVPVDAHPLFLAFDRLRLSAVAPATAT